MDGPIGHTATRGRSRGGGGGGGGGGQDYDSTTRTDQTGASIGSVTTSLDFEVTAIIRAVHSYARRNQGGIKGSSPGPGPGPGPGPVSESSVCVLRPGQAHLGLRFGSQSRSINPGDNPGLLLLDFEKCICLGSSKNLHGSTMWLSAGKPTSPCPPLPQPYH